MIGWVLGGEIVASTHGTLDNFRSHSISGNDCHQCVGRGVSAEASSSLGDHWAAAALDGSGEEEGEEGERRGGGR